MPRKDLTAERTAQILDALEACVVRHGLGATSLEQVAEEAGVKRSIIRHYVGNRDDLVLAMARRLVDRYREQLREMDDAIRDAHRIDDLLDCLFAPPTSSTTHDVLLVEALIKISEEHSEIRDLMVVIVEDTISATRDQLRREFPHATASVAWTVAYGVVGICFNYESLVPLALSRRHHTAARASALALIETLRGR